MTATDAAGNPQESGATKLAWALRFAWESGRALTLANAALTVLQGVVPLFLLYVMKLIVDTVAAGVTTGDHDEVLTRLTALVAAAGVVVLVDRALGTIGDLVRALHAQRATDRVYRILHAQSVAVDLAFYERPDYYDTLHRAQQEAPYRPARILDSVFRLGQSAVSLLAIGGLLLTLHWSIPVLLILAGVPGLLIRFVYARRLFAAGRRQTPSERLALYFHAMLTSDGHAKEIRLFDLGGIFAARFELLRDRIRAERSSLLTRRAMADLFAHVAVVVPIFALFGVLAYRTARGLVSVGDLVMFYQAMQRAQSNLNQFAQSIGDLYENHLFLANVHEFMALRPAIRDDANAQPFPRPIRTGIAIQDLRFRYPHADHLTLDGVSLHVRPGEHIALVGENGCGKTTLVKLLARLYDPTGGAIRIDGTDLRELRVRDLRQAIAVVFQDYAKYNVAARDNIWFGDIARPPDAARIRSAAEVAGIHEVIAALPRSYDNVLGRKFEAGAELSIGEWQKVALARAFLRDAEIVILDEPSSALDARAEAELFERFVALFQDRTAVLVRHRLSTVKMVDRIYFMEGGRIVESGSHDDLIGRGGRYAEMFEIQARHYR